MDQVIPVWMDVDTGTDDAVAVLLLHALKNTEIVGLSAVTGNCSLENAFRNTRSLNALLNTSYPVYAGAKKPLLREPFHAAKVHGENGLGDVLLPLPEEERVYEEAAWDALYAAAKNREGELRLVATGPLTNLAIAFSKYPELPGLLHSIYIMGGATTEGNVTPAAEFNFYADPDAAEIVMKCGAPIVLFPLDVTESVCLTPEDMEELKNAGNEAGRFVYEILQYPWEHFHSKWGNPGVQMHDSCPVLYLAHPELFDGVEAGIAVETKGTLTLGKTVTDLYSDKELPYKNALVILSADTKAFVEALKELISGIG